MVLRPVALTPKPGVLLSLLGGLVAMLLLSALIFLAPVLGFPFIDLPRIVGGLFTESPAAAFSLGFWLFFLVGVFVFAPLLSVVWMVLPGRGVGIRSALVKGLAWGLALWVASGLLLPAFFALNRLGEAALGPNPGLFAIRTGWLGAAGVLGGHLAFGAALALVAVMGRGMAPLETLGWSGYEKALAPVGSAPPGEERLPTSPGVGER